MSIRSAITGAAVLAALFFCVRMYGSSQHTAGYAQAQNEYTVAAAQAEVKAREIEQQKQTEVDNVRAENEVLRSQNSIAISSAADTANGLRSQLTAANRRESAEAARAGRALDENARITAELRNVVGMCSARYTALAAVADGYRSDLIGLQGYVEAIRK